MKQENIKVYDFFYLLSCGLNNKTPDKERIDKIDLESIYDMSVSHSVEPIITYALESVGLADKKWRDSKNNAIRKEMLFDMERNKIISFMEKNEISHMPLKGVILKTFYPKPGMRKMADNDIWFDESKADLLESFMRSLGYKDIEKEAGCHDIYTRPPVYNFEMHRSLFNSATPDKIVSYFSDIYPLLIKDENKKFGYSFSKEDFYIYVTAHEYKHFTNAGIGVRALVDCWVYVKKYGDILDWRYIKSVTDKLDMTDFEQSRRALAQELFADVNIIKLNKEQTELLKIYMRAATYGTFESRISSKVRALQGNNSKVTLGSKLKYFLKWCFPGRDAYKDDYPFIYKHKILVPFGFVPRVFKALVYRRKRLKTKINTLRKM
ncbi:MAG: nucleotidyltransferase family protein [Ruminococcus sp.]|nr:nucleotidyltransferase family protein [Ruminococcus sp.]